MSPEATEGGAVPPASPDTGPFRRDALRSALPPSVLPDISPSRGEIGLPLSRRPSLPRPLASGRCAANDAEARHRDVSAAKAFIGKAARFVGQQAVQLHGGMGMSAELIVSHYFKRLTLINATFGDVDHHVGLLSERILTERA